MTARQADFVRARREAAWAFGREYRDGLVSDFCGRYRVSFPPPPALIIDELLTDFIGADLRYDPLPNNIFAKTESFRGHITVTVNSLTKSIPGVIDAQGTENTGKWHEAIHIVRNADLLRVGPQSTLPGMGRPPVIACYRSPPSGVNREVQEREFWAEEAGRAAAISHKHLARSEAFNELLNRGERDADPGSKGWRLLCQAAADIGVNRTALVKQLQYEGRIAILTEGGRRRLNIQPTIKDVLK